MRDIGEDYHQAMVAEYKSYKVAGRAADAEHVAAQLKETFGYDVDTTPDPDATKDPDSEEAQEPDTDQDAAERADDPGAPERAVPAAPARRAAKKTAPGRPAK